MKYHENYQNVAQRHEMSKCCWRNGTDRLALHRIDPSLQYVKHAMSTKHNKAKHYKTRCAVSLYIDTNIQTYICRHVKGDQSSWNKEKKRSICRECQIGNEWMLSFGGLYKLFKELSFYSE